MKAHALGPPRRTKTCKNRARDKVQYTVHKKGGTAEEYKAAKGTQHGDKQAVHLCEAALGPSRCGDPWATIHEGWDLHTASAAPGQGEPQPRHLHTGLELREAASGQSGRRGALLQGRVGPWPPVLHCRAKALRGYKLTEGVMRAAHGGGANLEPKEEQRV